MGRWVTGQNKNIAILALQELSLAKETKYQKFNTQGCKKHIVLVSSNECLENKN